MRKSCQNRKQSNLLVCVLEGSVICNPSSWVPLFSSRATFSLVFTGYAFLLVGGGPRGSGRALPFLLSCKGTIHHSFRTRAGLNFGRALKSAGNTGAASGRGHRFE